MFFNNADMFVFPTYYPNECFPLVLLEAMQHGLPCISTDEGGISSIIEDGKTGLLVNRKDAEDLANKMEVLVKDATLRYRMGMAGKQRFDKLYTKENFEDRLSKILTSCSAE